MRLLILKYAEKLGECPPFRSSDSVRSDSVVEILKKHHYSSIHTINTAMFQKPPGADNVQSAYV